MDRRCRPFLSSTHATNPLTTEASTETSRPIPTSSMGRGWMNRCTAVYMMTAAAMKIIIPSAPAEKYSALECPKGWFLSGGRIDTLRATRAMIAATRLTRDSAASERSPTDPVIRQARVFSRIVTAAAAIDSHAKRLRSSGGRCRGGASEMSGIVVTQTFSQPILCSSCVLRKERALARHRINESFEVHHGWT